MQLHFVQFDLAISAAEYQALYGGWVRQVLVRARDGRKVQLPCNILQPFVEHRGVYGTFEVGFTAEGKFHSIRRLTQQDVPSGI
ncbi:MAG TPA: DUF2835 domain-containing protein [Cellvibrionaceae bacterium]|nr:DUF2835 domain-containing protein [Cellvibrionaceae bacterium]HMW70559.1 DUF2835 domain-containing protein [Cellvibrionaceae bacterium]HMY40561.1 DUF2835 domain-containing protein [Marinagarivorans sp.]HNG59814.1 DUF2835 domain-containing protein [Cellvibrionaceae bacterium]